jgi:hypothetical protein
LSADFCMLPIPQTFSLGDPDSQVIWTIPPPHKVWMTEGLQYLKLFGQVHSRSVPMVLTCSDLDPRDLFVGCSKWRIITTYSWQAQFWIHVVRETRHSNIYEWGKYQFDPLIITPLCCWEKFPPFEV